MFSNREPQRDVLEQPSAKAVLKLEFLFSSCGAWYLMGFWLYKKNLSTQAGADNLVFPTSGKLHSALTSGWAEVGVDHLIGLNSSYTETNQLSIYANPGRP